MTESELKLHYGLYADLWKLFKKYSSPVADDMFWENLKNEANELYERYGATDFITNEVVNLQLEIERIWKDGNF